MGKRVTHIYACGGGAIKITADMVDYVNVPGFSDTKISRLDTSDKNLTANMSQSSVFVLKGADGSGKQRDHNYKPVVAAMSKILAQHQPEDYNIVIFTGGGGSGSVIGPVLVGELLQRRAPVIALVIGTTGDETQAQNSVSTIKSLGGVQQLHKRPVVFSYFEVNQHNSQADVDQQVIGVLSGLLNLLDSDNTVIDNKDIINFLDWTNVRKETPAQLVALELYNGDEINELTGKTPIGIASIYPTAERPYLPVQPVYSSDGTRSEASVIANKSFEGITMHYVVHAGPVVPVMRDLEKTLQRIRDNQRAQSEDSVVISGDDNVESTGMVL